ncbi:MAG TPA: PhoPQ-activated protein PqaA family protein [Candidatus Hydrogenedentes bacterium]|nr:PhoPQ-activated protein PqaA family protein [Candidatus Hydrogenedentota bacterium]
MTRRQMMFGRFAVAAAVCMLGWSAAVATPLDDYVAAPDPAFKYTLVGKTEDAAATTYLYHMVSQTWLDASKVDHPLWEHEVFVTVPKETAFTKAMMFIGGGGNPLKADDTPENDPFDKIALATKSIVAHVKQIPNQPLRFPDEKDPRYTEAGRKEDAMITYGWDKFLTGGDPVWLARLPMTKAVVRAMDLVQKEFPQTDGFFVAGGSKRGWTTWTVAAVDKRVIGIAPAVIDVLNFIPSLENHINAYGFWAPSVSDYVDMKITDRLHTPEMKALLDVVDPYTYRDRLTMPKYVCNSAGDQFFPADSWRFYWEGLKDEKFLCYFPNTDHGLNADAYFRIAGFYHALMAGTPRPKFAWDRNADGSFTVRCETKPTAVRLWKAVNPDARDFRLETLGKKYEAVELPLSADGVYTTDVTAPEKGWTAFFLEMEFPNGDFPFPFVFTTGVSILPDAYPPKK